MRIPLEWLKEFVAFTISPEALCNSLTMAGFEVEAMEKTGEDIVIEVNVTPNRPDCLSIHGIAREVSALLNLPLKFPAHKVKEETGECAVSVEITDEALCCRYTGRVIKDVAIGGSPEWMKKRLEQCGQRPINNVVDITNYVLLELGHPLHAFDMDELYGKKIKVQRAGHESKTAVKITTLDGIKRKLHGDSLVIRDADKPVAVAGIMGGIDAEVNENTRNIFLESAYFLPASIRKTAKLLGLKTESSYRFERGTDIELLEKALDRAAFLIADIAGGKVSGKTDIYPAPFRPLSITVRSQRVNKILGTSITEAEMLLLLQRLNLPAERRADFFIVTPPSYRTDLQDEIDVIEELARLYGYEKIPVTIPKTGLSREVKDKKYGYVFAIKESLRNSGFTEAINYSFMNNAVCDIFNISSEDSRSRALVLRNPINNEEAQLRTFIVPSLLQNLSYNLAMGNRDIRLFETSRVFINNNDTLPDEEHHIGAVYYREKAPSIWKEEIPDFYMVKGAVEALMDELRIHDYRFEVSAEPFLHPGQASNILVAGERLGFFGVLHPDISERLALKIKKEILVMEMNIDRLIALIPPTVNYASLLKYPHIDRDIALLVDEALPAVAILDHAKAYASELIEEVFLFDFYKGKNIPEGKKSLAFTIRYRSQSRTLTDTEIEDIHAGLMKYITEKTCGSIRGV